jgi:release factor glutamine methyltransferase
LSVAIKNADKHHCAIEFIEADILNPEFIPSQCFDIIISNPPYITQNEKNEMHERVLDFEPAEALFVTNDDPLQFYKAILDFAKKYLLPQGILFLELNQQYGSETEILYQDAGFITELRRDMYGNVRMLKAKRKA